MKRTYRKEYRVVLRVPENDKWEEQEILSDRVWGSRAEAEAERDAPLHKRWPVGSSRYIESRTISDWSEDA